MRTQKYQNVFFQLRLRVCAFKLTSPFKAAAIIALALPLCLCFSTARAQPAGSLDMTFGTSGKVKTPFRIDNATAVKAIVQTDGKIIAAGSAACSTCEGDFTLARYNPDGSLDASFGFNGKVFTDFGSGDYITALGLQTDGKIVAAGRTNTLSGNADFALARYNSNGTLDTAFDTDGKIITDLGGIDIANALAIQTDGKIVVAGDHFAGGTRSVGVVRFTTDGTPDPAFTTTIIFLSGSDTYLNAAAVQPADGKIVIGGYTTSSGLSEDFVVFRLNPGGALDPTFGSSGYVQIDFSGGNDRVNSLVLDSFDNSIVLTGSASASGGTSVRFAFARLTAGGSLDASFGAGGKTTVTLGSLSDYASAAAIQPDGKIVAGGFSIRPSGSDFGLVRLSRDGSLDSTFGILGQVTTTISANSSVFSVELQTDGKIVAAGQTYQTAGMARFALARYSASGALDSSFDLDGIAETAFGSEDAGQKIAVQADGKIVVAGYTDRSNGADLDFALARYNPDGSLDSTFGTGGKVTTDFRNGNDLAYNLAIQPDGKIVAVGTSSDGPKYDFALARYNSNGALDTSFDTDGKAIIDFLSDTEYLFDVAIQSDGGLIVTGEDAVLPAIGDFLVLRVKTEGVLDATFGTGGIARTDFGGNDKSLAVALQSDGKIVVIGDTSVGSVFATDFAIARYNANGSLDTTFDTDGKAAVSFGTMLDRAFDVAIGADGNAILAGYTQNSAGDFDFAVARFKTDGSLDPAFDSDGKAAISFGSSQESATSLAIQTDGRIIVAGYSYASPPDFAVARLNYNGSLDTSFDTDGKATTDFGGADLARGVAIQPDNKILVAGTAEINSDVDFALARYNAFSPTAGTAQISGRVRIGKRGIQNVRLMLADSRGEVRRTQTNSFGFYRFSGVPTGETYVLTVFAQRYAFSQPTQILNLAEDLEEVNFISEP